MTQKESEVTNKPNPGFTLPSTVTELNHMMEQQEKNKLANMPEQEIVAAVPMSPEEELDAIEKKHEMGMAELQAEKEQLVSEIDFSQQIEDMDAIANLERSCRDYIEAGKPKKAQATRVIIEQLIATKSLAPLKERKYWDDYSKLNNKGAKDARHLMLKKIRGKLLNSKKYTFMPPELLEKQIRNRLPEGRKNLAGPFMDTLYGYIDKTSLKKSAIFITHTFNRIVKLAMDNYDHELVQQIIEIGELRLKDKTSPTPRIMKKGKKNANKARVSKKRR